VVTGLKNNENIVVERDNIDRLKELYKDGSYAVVSSGGAGFVPLTVRHVDMRFLRGLYDLGVSELVVYGKKFSGLCQVCRDDFMCLQKGRGRAKNFRCRASPEKLTVITSRRGNGRDRE
jgi:hypothetical protein